LVQKVNDKGKVIQKNQLDATITIYWSSRSAQHVSGNLLPIFRSVRLRFLQHMIRGELRYLAPLGSENISAPYFKQCFFQGGYYLPDW